MTTRLEEAIKQLDAEAVEQVTALAEFLLRRSSAPSGRALKLDWVGCLRDAPEKSGVEAQNTANQMRLDLLEKGMPK